MPTVFLQRHEAVLEIVLNRPEILNAVNRESIAELG
jgi:enoyl-CoA hydratase/carnithine racemase